MMQMTHIAVKEFKDYFISPIAYIVIGLFLMLTGWFFFSTFFIFDRADLRGFFGLLPTIFSFVIPAITMRLFSEEMNVGSYETLLTLPVSLWRHCPWKVPCSPWIYLLPCFYPTLAYPLFISLVGECGSRALWQAGISETILLAGAYCSLGLFASSLTRNQIVAFILGASMCFTLTVIDKMLFFLPNAPLQGWCRVSGGGFSFPEHFQGCCGFTGSGLLFERYGSGSLWEPIL